MKLFFKATIIFVLFCLAQNSYAQVGISYSTGHIVGVDFPLVKNNYTLIGQVKLFANRDFDDLSGEFDLLYKFSSREYHRFFVGVGFKTDVSSEDEAALTIPLCLEIFPFQDFKRFSVVFEVAPEIYFEGDQTLRSILGVKYTLGE